MLLRLQIPARLVALTGAMLLPVGAAHAATAGPATFTVSATIANFCTISAANVAFGTVNAGAAATNTASSVTLTCNKGATVSSVALNDGANFSGTKRMYNGTSEYLSYHIDRPTGANFDNCPTPGADEWNATSTIIATPLFGSTGGAKLIKLCASIPSGQYPSAGAYLDTVQVTATYN